MAGSLTLYPAGQHFDKPTAGWRAAPFSEPRVCVIAVLALAGQAASRCPILPPSAHEKAPPAIARGWEQGLKSMLAGAALGPGGNLAGGSRRQSRGETWSNEQPRARK